MKTQKLEQPTRRTTTYVLQIFSYLGSKLWGLFASEYSEVNDVDNWKSWLCTGLDQIMILLWDISFDLYFVCFRNDFFINLIANTILHSLYLHYLYVVY